MDTDAIEWLKGAGFSEAGLLALLRYCEEFSISSLDGLRALGKAQNIGVEGKENTEGMMEMFEGVRFIKSHVDRWRALFPTGVCSGARARGDARV
jgi:hypothetical protein